jgi:hypothetical protein
MLCLGCGNRPALPNNYVCLGCERYYHERFGITPRGGS